ncbi:hypothetical protein [Komagataeibacter xylinus]|uniref:hypothetical protein n=1 Tax=Komagataeibacter xylinus TaxID=28448 RepID=UPI000FDF7544|nr:hypothetical protein [Komagataeibacter xylinus]AZV39902.1 hypothetical protein CXP35_15165 [Komagataeibacter xylinus]
MVYQIDDTTAVASQPALPTDSIGAPGFFTGGSTSGGAPTRVRYWWLNMVQQELLNIALAAGLTADKTDNTQCITAIKALAKQAASGAVLGSPGVLATGDVAGSALYYSAALGAPAFTYGATTVGLLTTTALDGYVTTGALTTTLAGYLALGGGNVTGDMDWGSKTAAGTATHRFWSAGPPAAGDATPDATLTVTGGTPGTANQGTFRLSTGTFDLSGSGKVLVPDVVDFTTQGALGARVAEGRYVGSVLAAGTTNVRITDIQEDASGNLIATMSDGTTESYAPFSCGVFEASGILLDGFWTKQGNVLRQMLHVSQTSSEQQQDIIFPFAYTGVPVAQVTGRVSAGSAVSSWVNITSGYPTATELKVYYRSYLSSSYDAAGELWITVEGILS